MGPAAGASERAAAVERRLALECRLLYAYRVGGDPCRQGGCARAIDRGAPERIIAMSTLRVMGQQVSLDWLLRLVVLLAIPTYFGAASLNLGTYFALDPHLPIIPTRILRATIVETILGLA